ncbi:hypothetical protein M0R45_026992 [Rubus argutus]|uniref:Uncharacterized protein n=1 Tax=Rubus argutus TaxID=59490 RepID=A0AAW1X1N6_RUBAR
MESVIVDLELVDLGFAEEARAAGFEGLALVKVIIRIGRVAAVRCWFDEVVAAEAMMKMMIGWTGGSAYEEEKEDGGGGILGWCRQVK